MKTEKKKNKRDSENVLQNVEQKKKFPELTADKAKMKKIKIRT
jgi:hypothetical protein